MRTSPVTAGAVTPADKTVSVPALDDIWKPAVMAARAAPSVSPVRVIVTAAVPVATPPPVVRTTVVLAAAAAGAEVAVKDTTLLAMEVTDPKK